MMPPPSAERPGQMLSPAFNSTSRQKGLPIDNLRAHTAFTEVIALGTSKLFLCKP
jgi:hypothetical protein